MLETDPQRISEGCPLTASRYGISDDIGTIAEDGFELNLNKMEAFKKYHVVYDGSVYRVHKNEKNELTVSEIGWAGNPV